MKIRDQHDKINKVRKLPDYILKLFNKSTDDKTRSTFRPPNFSRKLIGGLTLLEHVLEFGTT